MPIEKPVPDGHVEVLLFKSDVPLNFYFADMLTWKMPDEFANRLRFLYEDRTVIFFPENVQQITMYGNSPEFQEAVQVWILDQHQLNHPERMMYQCQHCVNDLQFRYEHGGLTREQFEEGLIALQQRLQKDDNDS
jgi:hypothetical protein